VDVLGDARADRYAAALEITLKDPGVDGLVVILTPQTSTDIEETAQVLYEVSNHAGKPVTSCWMGKKEASKGIEVLAAAKIPNYPFPERAVAALGAMYRFAKWRQQPEAELPRYDVDKQAVADLLAGVRAAGRDAIGDAEAQTILKAYGITTPQSTVAATPDEAVAYCEQIGYPVVMKIASPDILHKSDVGGIIVGVRNADQARSAFDTLIERAREHVPEAEIWGAQVQEMVMDAREIIIGMNRDPQFGPLIMFGLGGIYVEVLKDVTFRVAPMSRIQAQDMIESIHAYGLLQGVRGQQAADMEAIIDTILRISQLVTDFPEIAELDINPLLVRNRGEGAVAVDMRLILK
jgi:acyl-CoA synthetase (NDP forming)